MLDKINKKIEEEIEKIISKKNLSIEEIQFLISVKKDIESEERLNKMYSTLPYFVWKIERRKND